MFVDGNHQEVHIFLTFMHFVQNYMRVLIQWIVIFAMDHTFYQNTGGAKQDTRVIRTILPMIRSNLFTILI